MSSNTSDTAMKEPEARQQPTSTNSSMGAHQRPLRIGIVAGEASGDILGASLMASLKEAHNDVEFIGVGGDLMEEQGLHSLFPMETLSVMGVWDVLKNLPSLLRARKTVVTTMLAAAPDVFIGIDAPDFTLPIERKLKDSGIKTVHYVSPSVWAWRPKRIFKIAKATDMVLGILPFEAEFYARYQVPYTFVGHPLADKFALATSKADARKTLGLAPQARYIGLLPGSRGSEVGQLARPFIDAAYELSRQQPELKFLVPLFNANRRAQFNAALAEAEQHWQQPLPVQLFAGQSQDVIAASDATILASGTVSLETMLIKRPMVVCYRFGWFNFHILRHFVTLEYFSLPNLLHGGELVKELLQDEVNGERIAAEVLPLLTQDQSSLIARFDELHQQLRCDAGAKSAAAVLALVEK